MGKKIVNEKIDEPVDRNSQTDRKRRFASANHQTYWNQRENDWKNVVQFEVKLFRQVMCLMNAPANAVKYEAVNEIGKNLHSDESENC